MKTVHGTAKWSKDGKEVTITVDRKKGKKTVKHSETYAVSDAEPDPVVAFPVIALTKPDGTVYHISKTEWGVRCDCPFGTISAERGGPRCKHTAVLIAKGLFKEDAYPGAEDATHSQEQPVEPLES